MKGTVGNRSRSALAPKYYRHLREHQPAFVVNINSVAPFLSQTVLGTLMYSWQPLRGYVFRNRIFSLHCGTFVGDWIHFCFSL